VRPGLKVESRAGSRQNAMYFSVRGREKCNNFADHLVFTLLNGKIHWKSLFI
jgi:hypothetical protein